MWISMVATTLVLGAGDFALKIGSFTLGGIGTATFGAIILNAILQRRGAALANQAARQHP
jgi:putative pyrimidine permease RutG